jgi:hypothetical protein
MIVTLAQHCTSWRSRELRKRQGCADEANRELEARVDQPGEVLALCVLMDVAGGCAPR